ncbi:hypothetical protein SSP531S_23250 [Streptomyces spongiicola]|uniref:Uncharacterized protein n=1 Tax=Streptomyces spongiicola TaxID=1690221 RepID=A0A388SYF4_9ACTN|nr:hypothetical protein SSP531S_23250 [Streptomyces spongiicola]
MEEVNPRELSRVTIRETKAVHKEVTLTAAMAPRFRIGRFTYVLHDVDALRKSWDLGAGSADLLMNTTRAAYAP